MPQNDKANGDPSKTDKKDNRTSHAGLWWIVLAGGVLFLVLLFVSVYLPNLTERVKFFTVTALSLLVVVVIAVQAYIYRRQWEAMENQTEYAQRAYVSIPIANLDVGEDFGRNQFFIFSLRIKNCGNTPANDVEVVLTTGVEAEPPDPRLPASNNDSPSILGLIAPGSDFRHWIRSPEPRDEQVRLWV